MLDVLKEIPKGVTNIKNKQLYKTKRIDIKINISIYELNNRINTDEEQISEQ